MTTPLSEIGKPEAERYKKGRKLYLVPLFLTPPDPPPDLQDMMERYWSGAGEHVARLEAGLGPVDRVYHEMVFLAGEEGAKLVQQLNPRGHSLVNARYQGGAQLEATEDQAMIEESSDWQRCLSIGLMSQKAYSTILQAYMDVTGRRYEYMASRIDDTLKEEESAILVVGDNHRIQFPSDIQVFYVAPPALNDLRRWVNDRTSYRPDEMQPEGEENQPDE